MLRPDLARAVLEKGVFEFGAFRLKLHETHPEAPLSPFYLSFRRPPKGKMDEGLLYSLTDMLRTVAEEKRLRFDAVTGIPEAGEPFAAVFAQMAGVPLLKLDKEESDGKRRVYAGPKFRESLEKSKLSRFPRVLVVDDLVTKADSKFEALYALVNESLPALDVLVIVDREQGGREELEARGFKLYAAWTISDLLIFYSQYELVEPGKYWETVRYLAANR